MDRSPDIRNGFPGAESGPAADRGISESGGLTVRVSTGYGLFPLSGVMVTVFTEDPDRSGVFAQSRTDSSGSTPKIVIPSKSFDGDALIPPDRTYTVESAKEGYLTGVVQGVRVYPGVDTTLDVNLTALPDRPGASLSSYDREIIIGTGGSNERE